MGISSLLEALVLFHGGSTMMAFIFSFCWHGLARQVRLSLKYFSRTPFILKLNTIIQSRLRVLLQILPNSCCLDLLSTKYILVSWTLTPYIWYFGWFLSSAKTSTIKISKINWTSHPVLWNALRYPERVWIPPYFANTSSIDGIIAIWHSVNPFWLSSSFSSLVPGIAIVT